MRRLPVYFLLDTSGSMAGEPIHALSESLNKMVNFLLCNPSAIECTLLSFITFNNEVHELVPLSKLESLKLPQIGPAQGATHTGKVLEFYHKAIQSIISKRKSQSYLLQKPLVFLVTDGVPTDIWAYLDINSRMKSSEYGLKIGCAISNNADITSLKSFTNTIIKVKTNDSESIQEFAKWAAELIINQINSDDDFFDNTEVGKPTKPILPALTNKLILIN